nr:MAG TPA: hypothetical protein [Microviridae sp.]
MAIIIFLKVLNDAIIALVKKFTTRMASSVC